MELFLAGVNTLRYTVDLGDMSKNEMEKCFCPTPETCLSRNLYDLSKCLGAPIIGSLPHFYESEPKYLELVEGLHPTQVNIYKPCRFALRVRINRVRATVERCSSEGCTKVQRYICHQVGLFIA